ncbi:MAG TPA: redoxin domain-containing protein [Pirellulaceae bacterium]|nr:redoxin domain-containing protein [Pirellulaceae bacterium]
MNLLRMGGLVVALLMLGTTLARASEPLEIGQAAPNIRFKDIRYLPRSLDDLGEAKAYVIVFTNTTCPLVQRYWPKLNRLEREFRDAKVHFLSINASDGEEIAEIAQQAIDFNVEFPCVRDSDGSCARALGVKRTPEVVVLDAKRKLRYRGRIDDQYRLGGARPAVKQDELSQAIAAVIAEREVATPETPVDGCLLTLPQPPSKNEQLTFYRDVLPLMQKHCQECHRPQGTAPFALMSYEQVSAHAEMIAEVAADRRMPPWYASRKQQFHNERGLSADERALLASWVKSGTLAGKPEDAPAPRVFDNSDWEIGKPDLVTTAIETHSLPAEGFVDYKYAILPHVFLKETWISAAEIKPSNPSVVHHCNMAYVTFGQQFDESNFITGRVPGGTAMVLDEGLAFRIPAGSVVGLQIHYTTTGKPEKNRMSVGFRFPRHEVRQELRHLQVTTSRFEIPALAAAHPVQASRTLPCDATGVGMFSHMHLRGKDMTFRALLPTGQQETLLSIPNYHYDWQQNYRWQPGSKKFPKGTQIDVLAHFDNSAFNPFNPDPTKPVRNGPQTVQEMMFGFLFYTADGEDLKLKVDPKTGYPAAPQANTP